IANAPTGPTKPDAGVIATSPATAPEQMPTTVGLPLSAHSTSIQVKPATAVAICVTIMAIPACIPALTAEPADPEQGSADKGEHHIVPGPPVVAFAEHDGAHQPGHAGIDMHDGTAGEIENLDPGRAVAGGEDSVRTPDPMRNRRVDENGPQPDEPEHGREFHALGEAAGDQRRRNDGKGHLEADVDALR